MVSGVKSPPPRFAVVQSSNLPGEDDMTSAHDVAAYILQKKGEMTAMKLHRLVYYSQAWSLVWDEEALFNEPIHAWANGPVIPAIYKLHRGIFKVSEWPKGDPSRLTPLQQETVDAVLKFYGHRSSQWLNDLAHRERPWREARRGILPGEPCTRILSLAALAEYYGSLGPAS